MRLGPGHFRKSRQGILCNSDESQVYVPKKRLGKIMSRNLRHNLTNIGIHKRNHTFHSCMNGMNRIKTYHIVPDVVLRPRYQISVHIRILNP